jgi:hypothetical protein
VAALLVASFATISATAGAKGTVGANNRHWHHQHWGSGHHGKATCTGTTTAPGVLSGTYDSNVVVNGFCIVNAGPAVVNGNLVISDGSAVVAAFGQGNSSLSVNKNVFIASGATLILGCEPIFFTCLDDPGASTGPGTLTSAGTIKGHLIGVHALGIIVHASTIGGNAIVAGGGGGQSCATPVASPSNSQSLQLWATIASSAPYVDFEDTSIGGNELVFNLATCWSGTARVTAGKNVAMINDQLADPDGIEILANTVSGNLLCFHNSYVWDSSEANFGQTDLFPRTAHPNTVGKHRLGQCVLSSPTTQGGPLGPGPF